MDFALSDDQQLLRGTARAFLDERVTPAVVRALWSDPRGERDDLWKELARLGWLGLALPEAHGGSGLFRQLQQLGRRRAGLHVQQTGGLNRHGGIVVGQRGDDLRGLAVFGHQALGIVAGGRTLAIAIAIQDRPPWRLAYNSSAWTWPRSSFLVSR